MDLLHWPNSRLGNLLRALELHYGRITFVPTKGVFEQIVWEMVAYLTDDAHRLAALRNLENQVGLTPEAILSASPEILLACTRFGSKIAPELRAERLVETSQVAISEYEGDLDRILNLTPKRALKELQKFPMIGLPGAEKILLFSERYPVLALDSNGMRVLLRLGFGEESKSYSTSYRSVRLSVVPELPLDYELLQQGYQLLRRHGQTFCRSSVPDCVGCPIKATCPTGSAMP